MAAAKGSRRKSGGAPVDEKLVFKTTAGIKPITSFDDMGVHRIGRAGRFGRESVAINFVKSSDMKILRDIERCYSTRISEMPADLASKICCLEA